MKTELKNIDKSRIVVEIFNTSLQEQIHKKKISKDKELTIIVNHWDPIGFY